MLKAILAMQDGDRLIGKNGQLPWRLKGELAHFKKATLGGVLVMGRATWQSLPGILPERPHVVVSRTSKAEDYPLEVELVNSVTQVIEKAEQDSKRTWWCIGGAQLFAEMLPYVEELVLTRVFGEYEGDTFLPSFEERFECARRDPAQQEYQVEYWQPKKEQ